MGYSPVTQSEVLAFPCVFVKDDGTPFPLTGAALQMVFNPVPGSPVQNARFVGTGSWQITDPLNGLATYTNAATDFSNPGYWILTAVATFPGGTIRDSDPLPPLLIRPAP